MEVLFLLITNYKDGLLEKQGFNFDSRFIISCKEGEKNKLTLSVKENLNYIKDFFKPEYHVQQSCAKISNISAIVGENGAGKTSVLDYIKDNVVYSETNREEDTPFLFILREHTNTNEKCKHHIFYHPSFELSIIGDFEYESKSTSYCEFQDMMKSTKVIFFSNIFDQKNEDATSHLLNISTNYLAGTRQNEKKSANPRDLTRHKYREIERQIQFVYGVDNSLYFQTIPFQIPKQFSLYFVRNSSRGIDPNQDGDSIAYKLRKLQVSLKQIFGVGEEKKPYQFICQSFLNHIYNEIMHAFDAKQVEGIKFDLSAITDAAGKPAKSIFLKVARWLLDLACHISKEEKPETLEVSRLIQATVAVMIRYYHYTNKGYVGFDKDRNLLSLKIHIDGVPEGEIQRLFELYERSYRRHDYLEFLWRDMSSGENALLNIYARFYYAAQFIAHAETSTNNVLMLIDEGEIYLHPHWQSQLLSNLIEYLPSLLNEQQTMQIILTSNSPFIISDLPSSHVVFLKKSTKDHKSVVIEGLEDHHQTFAANIHTLLSHSFFMNDGLCGAFAKRKINAIVNRLFNESTDALWADRKDIEKFINIIGEPVIRNKLISMLQEKLSLRMLNIDKEIGALRLRIEDLERWKNDSNS